ncbi:unnamed protein product, partial [Rotaria sp. Silwood1]
SCIRVPTNAPNIEFKRELCPYANRGQCRYTADECKYLHTPCGNFDSCSQSNCPLAHARPLSSKLCLNGIRCFKPDCRFEHPAGWSACNNGVQCTRYDCNSNHPPTRKQKCPHGNRCSTNNCKLLHPNMSSDECLWGTKCQKWDFEKSHPIGRLQLCSNKDYSNNETCGYLHPPKYAKSPVTIPLLSYNKLNIIPDSAKEQSEMIELSAAKQNFLESFGISYSEILAGPLSTANDMITIKNRHDADERRNQYDSDHNMNQSEDEQEDEDSDDDDDDRKSTISNTSSNFTNITL